MNVCLSHTSLVEAINHGAIFLDEAVVGRDARPGRALLPSGFSPTISREEADRLCDSMGLSLPIHTLATRAGVRSRSAYLQCHVRRGGLGGVHVFRLSNGLYACSPEMLFLQMSSSYNLQQLIRLGFDLCGFYRRGDESSFGCAPATSVRDIDLLLSGQEGYKGLRDARRALRYVRGGSRSPRETDLAMKLGLPSTLGGEELGMPLMNHKVDLSDEATRILGQRYCLCDLYWPKERVCVEYNGKEYHRGYERNTHDRKRELALGSMGVFVLTAANDQLVNATQFDFFAKQVAKALGKRIRHRGKSYPEQRFILDRVLGIR